MTASAAFHEVRLPVRLAFGSTGGIERRTEIATLASGHERRSTPWADGRRRYLIGGGARPLADLSQLSAFFEARRGRLHGFRFKDFADFRSCAPAAQPGPLDQPLGEGDGAIAAFSLGKAYGDYLRPIAKPVEATVRVAVDGVETEAFIVDPSTGIVTFETPPPEGAVLTAGFEFDVPVRFDSDRLDLTLEGFEAGRLVAVPLVEVRA